MLLQSRVVGSVAALCAIVLVVDRYNSLAAPTALLQSGNNMNVGFTGGVPFTKGPDGGRVYDAPHVGGTNGVYMGANGGGNGWARKPSAGPGPPYPPPGPSWEGVPARAHQQTMQQMRVFPGQKLAVGGVDIEGGQGEADSIFGSHDDHSTYGVMGEGWQGPGNGEAPGEFWNPAVQVGKGNLKKQQLRMRQQQLAGPVPYPEPGPEWYETEWGKSRHSQ